jgi:aminoglycoside phosphotransferase
MIDALLSWLNDRDADPAHERPRLTGGIVAGLYRNSSKVTVILFDERGELGAVVKATRRPSAEAALMAEYAALNELILTAPEAMQGAPRPIALERVEGHLVLAESPVTGEPMTARYYSPGHTSDPSRVAHDFWAAEQWLERFQRTTANGEAPIDNVSIDACVDDVRARYRREIGWSDAEEELFETVARRGLDFEGARLPLVGVHGDFWMGNLLMGDDGIEGVVDWELARLNGLPFQDIFKFPTSYGFYLDRAYPGNEGAIPGHAHWGRGSEQWAQYGDWSNLVGFRYSYFEGGWFPALVQQFIERQLTRAEVPLSLVAVFFPLFLAEQAMTLDDPVFRNGYRSALLAFWQERESTWLWNEDTAGIDVKTTPGKDS